jgi:hypothetical protein
MNLQESIRSDLKLFDSKPINESFTAEPENGFSMDVELRANSLEKYKAIYELWDMVEKWYHSNPKERDASGVPYDREMKAELANDTIVISNYIFAVAKDGKLVGIDYSLLGLFHPDRFNDDSEEISIKDLFHDWLSECPVQWVRTEESNDSATYTFHFDG